METTSNKPSHRGRRSPRQLIVGPVRASRGLGRATVKLMRSIGGRIPVPASRQTRASSKDGPGRLRRLGNRGVAAIRLSITTTLGLPARAAGRIKRRAGRGRDLAGAIRPEATAREPVDRGHTARGHTKTAVTSIGRTAGLRRKVDQRAAPTKQAKAEATPKARATTRRTRQRRTSQQGKPEQARRTQGLEQHTVRELREQARKAGIERSSSMTKQQLIKALRDHR